ncbi:hypothetical protein [Bacteroides neonati]|uniref:hypothetical protein n=1 Tax=Bacteroides neonati TaxID=1347393 RepID=UPI0005A60E0B|nr:hypothetical protein [Bacteroides neonati]
MKIRNLLSVMRHNQSKKGLFVILHSETNFVSLSDGAARLLKISKGGIPFIFVYKTEYKGVTAYALKRVNYQFAAQTQVGLVSKNRETGYYVFENLCPTNQSVFFDLGLPHNKDQRFNIIRRAKNESTDYILQYDESNSK